ncbi:MAG: GDP-mannose 4,6-dehydratase [Lachnospiraceae bacterium]|nr:GDP-mannose 4,6-dehydratase [Lachnospiraceae bacterium]
MKKALVFGMDGFVGDHMARELTANGYEVYASSSHGNKLNTYDGWYGCDLTDADQVKNVIAEVSPTHIVNLAGQSNVGISWKIPRRTVESNVCGPLNILEAIHQCELDCDVMMIGSSEEYGISDSDLSESDKLDASNPYGISKEMLEKFCFLYRERYKMRIHYVRSFNHTGIGQNDNFVIPSWCKQVAAISLSGRPGELSVGNLDIIRDFSNVKDIVRAYRLILESDDCNTVYNVGSGVGIPLRKILDYIVSLCEYPVEVKVDPKLIRPIENPRICCNSDLLKERLGWKPEYDIFRTVKEIYDFYYENEKE